MSLSAIGAAEAARRDAASESCAIDVHGASAHADSAAGTEGANSTDDVLLEA